MTKTAFVLAPFTSHDPKKSLADSLSCLYKDICECVIKSTVKGELGEEWRCFRNDGPENREDAVYVSICNNIYICDLIIADLVENNPNVIYELGIAHAIGRPSIVLMPKQQRQKPSDIYACKKVGLYAFEHEKVVNAYNCDKDGEPIGKKCLGACSENDKCEDGAALRNYIEGYKEALRAGIARFKAGNSVSIVDNTKIADARVIRYYDAPEQLYNDLILRLRSKVESKASGLIIKHVSVSPRTIDQPPPYVKNLIDVLESCHKEIGRAEIQDIISIESREQYNDLQNIVKNKFLTKANYTVEYMIKVVPFQAVKYQVCPFMIGQEEVFVVSSAESFTQAWRGFYFQGKKAVSFWNNHFERLWNSNLAYELIKSQVEIQTTWDTLIEYWRNKGYKIPESGKEEKGPGSIK